MFPTGRIGHHGRDTENHAMVAMIGPVYGETYTQDIMYAHEMFLFSIVSVVHEYIVCCQTQERMRNWGG